MPASVLGPTKLSETGTYLANLIARVAKHDESLLASISTDLSNLVSGIVRIEVEEDKAQGTNLIWAYTSEGKRFSLRELSDGTLRLLALAVLSNDPDQAGTLLLEEPENGVHPFRVKLLVGLLRSMATDFTHPPGPGERLRQVIVTSHSPALVSQLEDSEILFAHTADMTIDDSAQPLRITRMSSLKTASSPAQQAFTKQELLRYLDERDLESRTSRLKGVTP